jgi:hypothetical protein
MSYGARILTYLYTIMSCLTAVRVDTLLMSDYSLLVRVLSALVCGLMWPVYWLIHLSQ